jgi:hypothetical protein
VRRLAARTREIVEHELSSHFQDAAARIVAVSQSERVRSIEGLAWAASVNPERGAIAHAEGAIKAWAGLKAKAESENQANGNGEFTAHGDARPTGLRPGSRNLTDPALKGMRSGKSHS